MRNIKIKWSLYQNVLIPNVPPHINIELNENEVKNLLKQYNPYFIRTTSDFDSDIKYPFYYVVRFDKISIDELSKNTRSSKIRRGFKHCNVEKVEQINDDIIEGMYDTYINAFKRYKNMYIHVINKDLFKQQILNSNYDIWIVKKDDDICAYTLISIDNDIANTSVIKFHPEYLKFYSSYVLIYSILEYYLNDKNFLYVHNGSVSLGHDTNIQEWLIEKFKYKKTFSKLNIYYRNDIKILVKILYPFKKIIKHKKLSILLKYEEIRRKCELLSKKIN